MKTKKRFPANVKLRKALLKEDGSGISFTDQFIPSGEVISGPLVATAANIPFPNVTETHD